jgi:nucleotide-binding universal stress UspA family protein
MMTVPPKRIVVGTDFSPYAEAALDYAIALARPLGAEIVVVYAYEVPVYAFPDGALITGDLIDRLAKVSDEAMRDLLKKRTSSGVAIRGLVRSGAAWQEIDRVADEEKADLVVIGTHGRRGLARMVLGSVAERVVRTSHCPVLTVGPTGQNEAG